MSDAPSGSVRSTLTFQTSVLPTLPAPSVAVTRYAWRRSVMPEVENVRATSTSAEASLGAGIGEGDHLGAADLLERHLADTRDGVARVHVDALRAAPIGEPVLEPIPVPGERRVRGPASPRIKAAAYFVVGEA